MVKPQINQQQVGLASDQRRITLCIVYSYATPRPHFELVMRPLLQFFGKATVVFVGPQIRFSRGLGAKHLRRIGRHTRRSTNHVLVLRVVQDDVVAEHVSGLHTRRL